MAMGQPVIRKREGGKTRCRFPTRTSSQRKNTNSITSFENGADPRATQDNRDKLIEALDRFNEDQAYKPHTRDRFYDFAGKTGLVATLAGRNEAEPVTETATMAAAQEGSPAFVTKRLSDAGLSTSIRIDSSGQGATAMLPGPAAASRRVEISLR